MFLQLRSNQIILLVPCKTCRYLSRTNDGDDTLIYHKLTLVCCYHTTKSYETNRISHESRGLKLGYFFGNSDFVLRTTDQSISFVGLVEFFSHGLRVRVPALGEGSTRLGIERFTEVRFRSDLSRIDSTRVRSSRFLFKVSSSFIRDSVNPLLQILAINTL